MLTEALQDKDAQLGFLLLGVGLLWLAYSLIILRKGKRYEFRRDLEDFMSIKSWYRRERNPNARGVTLIWPAVFIVAGLLSIKLGLLPGMWARKAGLPAHD